MLTREMYDASKDPRIRALRAMAADDIDGRLAAAQAIDNNGTGPVVDPEIDLLGWNPPDVMQNRVGLGLTWWRNAFQPMPINPLHFSGSQVSDYDPKKPWARSIKTSLDDADYPAFDQAPAPTPALGPVGKLIGNGLYAFNQAACWSGALGRYIFAEGHSEVAPDGVTVYWHLGRFLGVPSPQWETAVARDKRIADERTAVGQ